MPTNRIPKSRHAHPMSDQERIYLLDEPGVDQILFNPTREAALWDRHRDWVLTTFVRQFPGHRPFLWWHHDSPQARLRLGGVGSALVGAPENYRHERGSYFYGIPYVHVSLSLAKFYRAQGHHDVTGCDPNDLPRYEGQGAYLQRLNLLVPGEKKRISPAAFEPECIPPEEAD